MFPTPKSPDWAEWLVQSGEAPQPRGRVLWQDSFKGSYEAVGACLDTLLGLLDREQLADGDPHTKTYTRLVLDEALVNCHKHGNKEDGSKSVSVCLYALPEKNGRSGWGAVLRDQGAGFSVDQVPVVDEEESLFLEHGRGVLLMREFLDAVQYFEGGRVLVMEKYRQ